MFKYRKKEHFLVSFIFISSDAYKRFRVDFFPDFTSESVLELAQCHEISLTLFQEVPAGHMMIIISFPQLLHPVRLWSWSPKNTPCPWITVIQSLPACVCVVNYTLCFTGAAHCRWVANPEENRAWCPPSVEVWAEEETRCFMCCVFWLYLVNAQ